MLTTSVIIILREVLEISLMLSIMLATTSKLKLSPMWFLYSSIAGFLGASLYASSIRYVAEWFDGVGQEIVDASTQIVMYFLLATLCLKLLKIQSVKKDKQGAIIPLMSVIIFLAISREGYEIVIYIGGFIGEPTMLFPVALGSALGTGIGISIASIFYYFLVSMENTRSFTIGAYTLMMAAAGMLLQASLLLTQADWLPSQKPLWDSSWLITEGSIPGQLFYALISYESTPTPIQAAIYFSGLFILLSTMLSISLKSSRAQSSRQSAT